MSDARKNPKSRKNATNPLHAYEKKSGKRNVHVTKSGTAIKVNSNLVQKIKARRDEKARRRAEYLATLPKSRVKRMAYRLQPKRLAKYWFSRDGLIMGLKIAGAAIFIVAS